MFDISPEKLLVVIVIALTVLGPERIPKVARGLGKARSELRRLLAGLTAGVPPDTLQALRNPRGALLDAVAEPRRAVSEAVSAPRLGLADAIADFKLAGRATSPPPSAGQEVTGSTAFAAPDDPALN